jgi:hypothetical protein
MAITIMTKSRWQAHTRDCGTTLFLETAEHKYIIRECDANLAAAIDLAIGRLHLQWHFYIRSPSVFPVPQEQGRL